MVDQTIKIIFVFLNHLPKEKVASKRRKRLM